MASREITEKMRLAAIAAGHAGRAAMTSLVSSTPVRWMTGPPPAQQLLLVPQDLRTADASLAAEMYDGYLGLAGTVAPVGSQSPFTIRPPSLSWLKELHAFSWLRHLHAAQDDVARERARTMLRDWATLGASMPEIAWETDIAARRLIALLSHAGFLLERVDSAMYDLYMSSLSRHLHILSVGGKDDSQGLPRLRATIATTLASLCVAEFEPYISTNVPALNADLDRQILPDGGHISRHPGAPVEILLDLLPLKQCFIGRSQEPPDALYEAINRIMPMIRFMRLSTGSLARFNGMGATFADQIATVLAYDDTRRGDALIAPKSGYARLACGNVVVIADVGSPPPLLASERATAGCLSFEFSSGLHDIVVNCGAPPEDDSEWQIVSRATAAHSTLSINDVSSSRLVKRQLLQPPREIFLLSNPKAVETEAGLENGAHVLRAAHDGYKDRFGLIHQRTLRLSGDGNALEGIDHLLDPRRNHTAAVDAMFAIRFHLHPRVDIAMLQDARGIVLALPNGERWQFTAKGAQTDIEESIFLADPIFRRRCLQIVLSGPCYPSPVVEWSFRKQPAQQAQRGRSLSQPRD
jgi:uncharacterized heparinase superfamily protein